MTHASPAGVYAHTANRDWENDAIIMKDGVDPTICRDIAYQLINEDIGKQLKVSAKDSSFTFFIFLLIANSIKILLECSTSVPSGGIIEHI